MTNARNAHRILMGKHFRNFLLGRQRGLEDDIKKDLWEIGLRMGGSGNWMRI
jgi:hypothetical protein